MFLFPEIYKKVLKGYTIQLIRLEFWCFLISRILILTNTVPYLEVYKRGIIAGP